MFSPASWGSEEDDRGLERAEGCRRAVVVALAGAAGAVAEGLGEEAGDRALVAEPNRGGVPGETLGEEHG